MQNSDEMQQYRNNCYHKNGTASPHQTRRLNLIRRLLRNCSGRLLDYGCGFGDIAWSLADRFDVTAVDVMPERVEWARREFAPVQFEVCAQSGLQFGDEQFDTVLSSVVIHWVQDPDEYLAEISRVLAPGGQLVILFQNQPVLHDFIRRMTGRRSSEQGFWNESHREMLNRLRRHDFSVEEIDCFYESPLEVVKSVRDGIMEFIQLPFRAFQAPSVAPYYGVRALKRASARVESVWSANAHSIDPSLNPADPAGVVCGSPS